MTMLRPVTPADLDAIHALQVRTERHDRIPFQTSREEFAEWLTDPDLVLDTDTRLAEVGGRIAAWGRIWHRPSGEREERCFLAGGVAPEHRGRSIGRSLLEWQIARSREILRRTPGGLPRYVRAEAYDFQHEKLRLFERAGMRPVRYAFAMLRELASPDPGATPLAAGTPPPGIVFSRWDRARDEEGRKVMNAAFADHWGSTPRGAEGWRHELDSYASRLELSFMATEAGRVVGLTRNGHFPDDEALTGRRDGWIIQIGVLRSHRKRGIASALIAASIEAFREAGFTHAALGVDSENSTGALGLYEQLGFGTTHRVVVCQIEG